MPPFPQDLAFEFGQIASRPAIARAAGVVRSCASFRERSSPSTEGNRSSPAAIRELQDEGPVRRQCRYRTRHTRINHIEPDHRDVKRRLRAMQGPRTKATAWAIIQESKRFNDSKRAGPWDYPAQFARPGLGSSASCRRLNSNFNARGGLNAASPQMQDALAA